MSDYNVFIKSLQSILNEKSTIFNLYSDFYKSNWNKKFKISSVAAIFRIKLKKSLVLTYEGFEYEINKQYSILKKILKLEEQITIVELNHLIDKITKILGVNKINLNELFDIEILLLKRAINKNDKYSGDMSFPGGKHEKYDKNTFETAVRETLEEIGVNLRSDQITSFYLGEMNKFDITIDFKYIVHTHLFMIFDLFDKINKNIILNENEINGFVWVRLSYFKSLEDDKIREDNSKKVIQDFSLFNAKTQIEFSKIILGNNSSFLLYGLTRRIVINLLGLIYKDDFKLKSKKNFLIYKLVLLYLQFITNPVVTYKTFQLSTLCFLFLSVEKIIFKSNIFPKF